VKPEPLLEMWPETDSLVEEGEVGLRLSEAGREVVDSILRHKGVDPLEVDEEASVDMGGYVGHGGCVVLRYPNLDLTVEVFEDHIHVIEE